MSSNKMIVFDLRLYPLYMILGLLGMMHYELPPILQNITYTFIRNCIVVYRFVLSFSNDCKITYTSVRDGIVFYLQQWIGTVTESKQSKEIATDDNTQLTTASSVHALTLVTAKHQATSYFDAHEVVRPHERCASRRTNLEHTSSACSQSSPSEIVAADAIVAPCHNIPRMPGAWTTTDSWSSGAPADPTSPKDVTVPTIDEYDLLAIPCAWPITESHSVPSVLADSGSAEDVAVPTIQESSDAFIIGLPRLILNSSDITAPATSLSRLASCSSTLPNTTSKDSRTCQRATGEVCSQDLPANDKGDRPAELGSSDDHGDSGIWSIDADQTSDGPVSPESYAGGVSLDRAIKDTTMDNSDSNPSSSHDGNHTPVSAGDSTGSRTNVHKDDLLGSICSPETRLEYGARFRDQTRSQNNQLLAYDLETDNGTGSRPQELAQAEDDTHEPNGELIPRDRWAFAKSLIRSHGYDLLVLTLPLFWSSGWVKADHSLSYLPINYKHYLEAFLLGMLDALNTGSVDEDSSVLTRRYDLKEALMIWFNRHSLQIERLSQQIGLVIGAGKLIVHLEVDATQFQTIFAFMTPTPTQQIAPPAQQVVFPAQQIAPPAQQVAPSAHQVVSSAQQVAPSAQQMTSPAQQIAPSAQQIAPSTQQVPLLAQQVAPSAQQVAPLAQQLASPAQQIASSAQQVAPLAQQVASPAQQVAEDTTNEDSELANVPTQEGSGGDSNAGAHAGNGGSSETEDVEDLLTNSLNGLSLGEVVDASGAEQVAGPEGDSTPDQVNQRYPSDKASDDDDNDVGKPHNEPKADSSGQIADARDGAVIIAVSKTERTEKLPGIPQTDVDYDQVESNPEAEEAFYFDNDDTLVDPASSIDEISDDKDSEVENFNDDLETENNDENTVVEDDASNTEVSKIEEIETIPIISQNDTSHSQVESVFAAEQAADVEGDDHRMLVTKGMIIGMKQAASCNKFTFRPVMSPDAQSSVEIYKFHQREMHNHTTQAKDPRLAPLSWSPKRKASYEEVLEPSAKRHHATWNTSTDVVKFSGYLALGNLFDPRTKKRKASEDLVQEKAKSPRIFRPLPRKTLKKTRKAPTACPALKDMIRVHKENERKKQAVCTRENNRQTWLQVNEWSTGRNCVMDYSMNPPQPYDGIGWRLWSPILPPSEAYRRPMENSGLDEEDSGLDDIIT